MISTGITGNIGTGKTYVCKVLEKMGYPVFFADKRAAKLLDKPDIVMKLTDRFGVEILEKDGLPNRKKIAKKVFNSTKDLHWLNQIIHPLVIDQWKKFLVYYKASDFCFMESAIIYEYALEKHFDYVILVEAPSDLAIKRVMDRDNITLKQVEERLKNQMPQDRKREMADAVIINDEKTVLMPQIINTLQKLSKKSV